MTKTTKNRKCYISIPISGYNLEERRQKIEFVKAFLIAAGFDPVSPMDKELPDEASYAEHMKADIKILLDCSAICLVTGWEKSKGCTFESYVAGICGIETLFYTL